MKLSKSRLKRFEIPFSEMDDENDIVDPKGINWDFLLRKKQPEATTHAGGPLMQKRIKIELANAENIGIVTPIDLVALEAKGNQYEMGGYYTKDGEFVLTEISLVGVKRK